MGIFSSAYFSLFVIITIGLIVGNIKIKGISLDSSAVIFVALVFGHFGIQVPELFQKIGLLLFIFSIGMQAGPGFFHAFRNQGRDLIIIASALVIVGALVTLACSWILGIDINLAVGIFAGALTSTPGLASAIESTQSELASIGYGIAYPFGVIGVILFIQFAPRILKINIKTADDEYRAKTMANYPSLTNAHFIVQNDNIEGKTIENLNIRRMTDANVSRVLHEGNASIPDKSTVLHKNDIIRAVGTEEALKKVELLIGSRTDEKIDLNSKSVIQWVIVTRKEAVNKTLSQINLFNNYNATVTRIRRSGIDITPKPNSQLRFGDKLLIACSGNIDAVTKLLGNQSKKLSETDILPISAGIVLGILLGSIEWPFFGGIAFKLGLTGGVLITALTLSNLGKTGPVIWNVSGPANQLLRQLGLLFFLASVGTNAGANLVETITNRGATLFIVGIIVTLVPMMVGMFMGLLMKVNFLSILGTLTGGMTSTPGLTAVGSLTDSDAPNIAYATVYPIAMVVLIICTQIMGKMF